MLNINTKLKRTILIMCLFSISGFSFAETYEGKSQVEINNAGKSFTNSINQGAPTASTGNTLLSTLGNIAGIYNSIANSTYNTNVIPSHLGHDKIFECTSYTQEEVNAMINSPNAQIKTAGIECDAVRTNERVNDELENKRIDPKKDNLITTFNENQKNAVQRDNNGEISITCSTSSGNTNSVINESCIIVSSPKIKSCLNTLSVVCTDQLTNKVITDINTECRGDVYGVDPSKGSGNPTFNIPNGKLETHFNHGVVKFWVEDKDRAIGEGGNFILNRYYGEGVSFWHSTILRLNGERIAYHRGDGDSWHNFNVNHLIVNGWNTVTHTGARNSFAVFLVPYFEDTKACDLVCKDTWTMQCTESDMEDDINEADDLTDYDE